MTRHRQRSAGRRGYTLMEMLLVQGVIVALVAMSWPALRGSLDKNRLLAAARQVRTELVQARLKAAETGVPQQFRYQTGDRRYEVAAATATSANGAKQGVHGSKFGTLDESSRDEDCDAHVATLDEEIHFANAKEAESNEQSDVELPKAQTETATLEGPGSENWSAPVVFLPNGRSSNARVRLLGARGFHVDVVLRGLTGSVTVCELTRDEDEDLK